MGERTWLGDIVVRFAEGTASAARGEPGVEAAGVESVATGQATDFVFVFESVDTDGAGVAGGLEELICG